MGGLFFLSLLFLIIFLEIRFIHPRHVIKPSSVSYCHHLHGKGFSDLFIVKYRSGFIRLFLTPKSEVFRKTNSKWTSFIIKLLFYSINFENSRKLWNAVLIFPVILSVIGRLNSNSSFSGQSCSASTYLFFP